MARKLEHDYGGMLVGAVVECMTAGDLPSGKRLLETAGAVCGGCLGSRIPDLIEPAIGFNHWGFAHSLTAGAGTTGISLVGVLRTRNCMRALGEEMFELSRDDDLAAPWQYFATLGGMLMYVIAGVVVGAPAGYVSHLVLDQVRSKSNLPVLC